MRKFIYKLSILLTPIVIVLIIPIVILKITGENFTEINSEIKSKEKYLIGYAYNEMNYNYLKWATVNENQRCSVIALGSSRVLQFRADMFDSTFYNAGYTVSKISDYLPFLKSVSQEKYPKYLILGLDQWEFNVNWDNGRVGKSSSYWMNSFSTYPKKNIIINVYRDLIDQKYSFDVVNQASVINKIGLNAIVNNKGFRNDGSIYYGSQILKLINDDSSANDYRFSDTYKRIENGNRRFEYGNKVNPIAIEKLNKLLEFCNKKRIKVIGIIPPFADSVFQKMMKTREYNYVKNLTQEIEPIFKKYNFEFYNYPSAKSCNVSDTNFIDGFHGGEIVYSKILTDILKKKSILNNVTSLEKLARDREAAKNRYLIYDY